jgi:MFS transporter, DHA1 family, multidrug resistance protein
MNDLFRETFFGRIVHLASGGRFFQQEEQRDPSRLQRYVITKLVSTSAETLQDAAEPPAFLDSDSENGSDEDTLPGDEVNPENGSDVDTLPGDRPDPEKGSDFQLIDWIDNDPEVMKALQHYPTISSDL